jgi:hypothetical protein
MKSLAFSAFNFCILKGVGAMATSEEYQRRAEECCQLAALTDDDRERTMLLQASGQWRRLANYKANREEAPSPLSLGKSKIWVLAPL